MSLLQNIKICEKKYVIYSLDNLLIILFQLVSLQPFTNGSSGVFLLPLHNTVLISICLATIASCLHLRNWIIMQHLLRRA